MQTTKWGDIFSIFVLKQLLLNVNKWNQGTNYTKAMEAIASLPFDLALLP